MNHQVYVANNGSDNVSILSGPNLTLLATVPVGSEPTGIAADPATGNVFVANYGSDNVSVISGSTNHVLVNDPVERGPYGVAVDNASDTIYVTDEEDANVSVLSGSSGTGITNISIGTQYGYALALEGIAYNSADGLLWIGGGANPLVAPLLRTSR